MNCPACGAAASSDARHCSNCGARLAAPPGDTDVPEVEGELVHRPGGDGPEAARAEGLASLIPYRNPKALAGYYCGWLSLIPLAGLVLAPVALLLGILGLRRSWAEPGARGSVHAVIAIGFGFLSLLCNPLVAFLVWKFWPWYEKYLT